MAQDFMPLILIGGLAVGGFLLYQSGALNSLFHPTPPPAAAPVAPVSGVSSATPCMGTDATGNPCACPSTATGLAAATQVVPAVGPIDPNCHRCRTVYPQGCFSCKTATGGWAYCSDCMNSCRGDITGNICRRQSHGPEQIIGIIPGGLGLGIPSSTGFGALGVPSTLGSCDCSKCGGSAPSSVQPSQFGSLGDLNNFVGGSIAQAGYGFRP